MAGTDTERFFTACSGCLVLSTDGNRCDKTATGTMSQELLKVESNKCLNYLYA